MQKPSYEELERELHECRSILNAIRTGKVDTVLGAGGAGAAVYKISSAEIEQENTRLIARLEETSRRKSDFLAGVSHELRSPLAAAREFVELVSESAELPAKLSRPLLLAQRNMARLARLIDDLLNLSRLEAGQAIVIRPQAISPADLVREAMATVGPLAESKRVRVLADVNQAGAVFGDLNRLTQVLVNLLLNAVRFSPAGQAVHLSAHADGNEFIRFEVSDAGPGVPREDQPRIFERYYQGSATDQPARGAGLGLAVARDIIGTHRGQIGIDSIPEQGASLWFTVPLCNNMPQRALVTAAAALQEAAGPLAVLLVTVPPGKTEPTRAGAALDATLRGILPGSDELVMLGGTSAMLILHLARAEAMRTARGIDSQLHEALGTDANIDVTVLALPGDVDSGAEMITHLERRLGIASREVPIGKQPENFRHHHSVDTGSCLHQQCWSERARQPVRRVCLAGAPGSGSHRADRSSPRSDRRRGRVRMAPHPLRRRSAWALRLLDQALCGRL